MNHRRSLLLRCAALVLLLMCAVAPSAAAAADPQSKTTEGLEQRETSVPEAAPAAREGLRRGSFSRVRSIGRGYPEPTGSYKSALGTGVKSFGFKKKAPRPDDGFAVIDNPPARTGIRSGDFAEFRN